MMYCGYQLFLVVLVAAVLNCTSAVNTKQDQLATDTSVGGKQDQLATDTSVGGKQDQLATDTSVGGSSVAASSPKKSTAPGSVRGSKGTVKKNSIEGTTSQPQSRFRSTTPQSRSGAAAYPEFSQRGGYIGITYQNDAGSGFEPLIIPSVQNKIDSFVQLSIFDNPQYLEPKPMYLGYVNNNGFVNCLVLVNYIHEKVTKVTWPQYARIQVLHQQPASRTRFVSYKNRSDVYTYHLLINAPTKKNTVGEFIAIHVKEGSPVYNCLLQLTRGFDYRKTYRGVFGEINVNRIDLAKFAKEGCESATFQVNYLNKDGQAE